MKPFLFYTLIFAAIIVYNVTIDIIKKIHQNTDVPRYEVVIASIVFAYIFVCITLLPVA